MVKKDRGIFGKPGGAAAFGLFVCFERMFSFETKHAKMCCLLFCVGFSLFLEQVFNLTTNHQTISAA